MTNNTSGFWKTAIIYGGLSGFFIITLMIGSFEVVGLKSSASSMVVGFLLMFFILSLIFFGMKRFRDREQGGVIKFSKAFMLGLAMALFSALVYVLVWEIYTAMTDNQFIGEYTAHLVEMQKTKGVSGPELTALTEKMETMRVNYANPGYRMFMTFFELFSAAFIVALISALMLHNPKLWARKG